MKLLERLPGQVRLTPAGERLIPVARRILDLANEASAAVRETSESTGQVVVGSIESITTYRLATVIELFHHRFPGIRLIAKPSRCDDTIHALRTGDFDIGFLLAEKTSHPGLTSVTLCEEPLVAVASPGHPLTREPEVTTRRLRDAKILSTEYGCPYRELFEATLSEGMPERLRLLEFGTVEAIKRMAVSGLGVTLLPRVTVVPELRAGQLAPIAWTPPFTVFSQLAWRKDKSVAGALRLFIDETGRAFREGHEEG